MSHIAVRMVADWLFPTGGGGGPPPNLNNVIALIPVDGSDAAAPSLTGYDETRQSWVATGIVPGAEAGGSSIFFPHVEVSLVSLTRDQGLTEIDSAGVGTLTGELVIAIKVVQRQENSALASTNEMYFLRGVRDRMAQFDHADNYGARQRMGCFLFPSKSMSYGRVIRPNEDVFSDPVLLFTYEFHESVPFTPLT